jgi:hypothetical protein
MAASRRLEAFGGRLCFLDALHCVSYLLQTVYCTEARLAQAKFACAKEADILTPFEKLYEKMELRVVEIFLGLSAVVLLDILRNSKLCIECTGDA